jgi:hypothetical protein
MPPMPARLCAGRPRQRQPSTVSGNSTDSVSRANPDNVAFSASFFSCSCSRYHGQGVSASDETTFHGASRAAQDILVPYRQLHLFLLPVRGVWMYPQAPSRLLTLRRRNLGRLHLRPGAFSVACAVPK